MDGRVRGSICEPGVWYFVADDFVGTLESWRENLKVIRFESISERNFLLEKLKIPQLSPTLLVEFIKAIHLEARDDQTRLGSLAQVWKDLDFVRRHRVKDLFLFAPSTGGGFEAICNLLLPSALASDFRPCGSQKVSLDFIDLDLNNQLSILDILEWEIFFVECKCQIPLLNFDLASLYPNERTILRLREFGEEEAQLGLQFLDMISSYDLSDKLPRLKVQAELNGGTSQVILPVSLTWSKAVYNYLLPSLDLPNNGASLRLAERLGVTVRADLRSCLKVLQSLVDNKVTSSDLYIEWLLNLKTFLSSENIPKITGLKLVCLSETSGESNLFFSVDQVYCCEESPALLHVCKYLGKTMVNFNHNRSFMSVETILIQLGCHKNSASIADIIECLRRMALDISLYNNQNRQSILTNQGSEFFREVFAELEKAVKRELRVSDEQTALSSDLGTRQKALELVLANPQIFPARFPVITHDNHVKTEFESEGRALICFESDVIQILKEKLPAGHFFVNAQIARQFPYLSGALIPRPSFLNSIFKIHLEHLSSNLEYTNEFLNAEFQKATKLAQIQVLKANYMPISVSTDEIYENVYNNIKFAIFDNRLVLIPSRNVSDEALVMLLTLALRQLLKVNNPERKSDEDLLEEARQVIRAIGQHSLLSNWFVWSGASSGADEFDYDKVTFHDEESDLSALADFYFVKNSRPLSDSMDEKRNLLRHKRVNNFYVNNELSFMTRVQAIENEPLKVNSALSTSERNETSNLFTITEKFRVNKKRQEQCGIEAEHFFCLYLKAKYGESFNELENWVSSARNLVYPSVFPYDDRLGYDFRLYDFLNLFTRPGIHTANCFIEVKGCDYEWDGKFHISHNEKDTKDKVLKEKEAYLIVIIEWVSDPNKIAIARIITWSENFHLLSLTPETYLATFKGDSRESDTRPRRQADNPQSGRYHVSGGNQARQHINQSREQFHRGSRRENPSKYF